MVDLVNSLLSSLGAGGILLFFVRRYYAKKDKAAAKREEQREEREKELADMLGKFEIGMDTLRLLSYARMSEETQRLLDKGFATPAERRVLGEMYTNYKANGWNGDMRARVEQVYSMPTSDTEE